MTGNCENCANKNTCKKSIGIIFGFCKTDFVSAIKNPSAEKAKLISFNLNGKGNIKKLCNLINGNVDDIKNISIISLSYECDTSSPLAYSKAFFQFEIFIKKFNELLPLTCIRYVVNFKPIKRNQIDMNCLLIFDGIAPVINRNLLSSLWEGYSKCLDLSTLNDAVCPNIGIYVANYFNNCGGLIKAYVNNIASIIHCVNEKDAVPNNINCS